MFEPPLLSVTVWNRWLIKCCESQQNGQDPAGDQTQTQTREALQAPQRNRGGRWVFGRGLRGAAWFCRRTDVITEYRLLWDVVLCQWISTKRRMRDWLCAKSIQWGKQKGWKGQTEDWNGGHYHASKINMCPLCVYILYAMYMYILTHKHTHHTHPDSHNRLQYPLDFNRPVTEECHLGCEDTETDRPTITTQTFQTKKKPLSKQIVWNWICLKHWCFLPLLCTDEHTT